MDFKLETANFKCIQNFQKDSTSSQSLHTDLSLEVKISIMTWCKKIIKIPEKDPEIFPFLFQDGQKLCELISKLFKTPLTLSSQSSVPSRSHTKLNIKKSMQVLKSNLKFKSNFLYSDKEIISGNQFVIWGLLFDIKSFTESRTLTTHSIGPGLTINYLKEKSRSLNGHLRPSINIEKRPKSKVTVEHIRKVKEWLVKLGIGELVNVDNGHFFQNPYKNGIILFEILKKLDVVVHFIEDAYSRDEVLGNIENCIEGFRKFDGVCFDFVDSVKILNGDEEAIWGFLFNLENVFRNYWKQEMVLYNRYQRIDLTESLKKWMKGLGVDLRFLEPCINKESLVEILKSIYGKSNETPIESLKRLFNLVDISDSDLLEPDIILLFLENLHRLQDNIPLQLERDYTCPLYLGRGLGIY